MLAGGAYAGARAAIAGHEAPPARDGFSAEPNARTFGLGFVFALLPGLTVLLSYADSHPARAILAAVGIVVRVNNTVPPTCG